MTSSPRLLSEVQQKIWNGRIPLEIQLSTVSRDDVIYYVNCPRLSYLPFLLPQAHAFFLPYLTDPSVSPHDGWFSYEAVPLKWHFPVGLLHDLYSDGATLPLQEETADKDVGSDAHDNRTTMWKLKLHFSDRPEHLLIPLDADGKALLDAFTNSVKEASFLRTGSGKVVMGLSKDDSTQLWDSVQQNDLKLFNSINQKLLHPPGVPLRHIPLKVYLPTTGATDSSSSPEALAAGHLKVVQTLISSSLGPRQPQTLGTALNSMLPSLFPSRRSPLLAVPVMHGAVLPLGAGLEELSECASYADGWLHVSVVMMS